MQASSQGAARAARAAGGTPRVIAIVGAGFSGTALAIQLLRHAPAHATRIVLVDPHEMIGAGVAYAARDYPYPLNVAAGQMSLDAAVPGDFLDYVKRQGIQAAAGDYLPRQVYGEYLRARYQEARAAAPARLECLHHRASALQLRRAQDGRWVLWLDDGAELRADQVVLALGNPPPASLPALRTIAATDRYVRDPWSIAAQGPIESVLLVGSGLTMVDAALRLAAIRPRLRHIHVLSRHGWLPQPQASEHRPPHRPDVVRALAGARGSIRALVRAFGTLMREVQEGGGDWREVLALARSQLPAQWRELDRTQRARFLRHVRSLWDVHRHRVPPGPLAAVRTLAMLGVLEVHAGRLEQLNLVEDAVEVIWRPRGAERTKAWLVDRVVNCTGPDSRAANHGPLMQSLLANGLVRDDALSLGIEVADDGRVITRDYLAADGLYYIGPWLRARDWESTAVPELREHALALARRLAVLPARPGQGAEFG
jgi:uncharacterized NAD(P)/FAD-binding protein YdhS